jgi:hypothetical protein
MRILFLIILVSSLGGCASWGANNRYAASNPSGELDARSINDLTAKVQTLSIVSPAEEAQLALAVQRARDLHAQLRAYDAAIAAAQQRQSKLKTRYPQVGSKTTLTKQSAFNVQPAVATEQKQVRSTSLKSSIVKTTVQLPAVKPPVVELTRSRGLRASEPAVSIPAASMSAISKPTVASTAPNVSLAPGAVQRVDDGFISKEHRFEIQNFVAINPSAQKANSAASTGRTGAL